MKRAIELLKKKRSFLLTTHVVPDGDGLGSQVALHRFLKNKGKTSYLVNTHATPDKFRVIDPQGEIKVFGEASLPEVEAVIVLDTHDWKMLGPLADPIRQLQVPVLFLDHHVAEEGKKGTSPYLVVDDSYGSTGELVYDLLRTMRIKITKEIALPIYVAMMTDTQNFRLKHTNAQTLRVAASLLETGLCPEEIFQHIYGQDSIAKVKFLGHVLERIETAADNRIVWISITKPLRLSFSATVEDTEAYVTHLSLIHGVEVALVFREEENSQTKVSLRGIKDVEVLSVARKLGGGGHLYAAGARVSLPLSEAIRTVVAEVTRLLG